MPSPNDDLEFDLDTGEEVTKSQVEGSDADEDEDEDDGDTRTSSEASDDDNGDNDGTSSDDEHGDDDREALRERRREERKQRKLAQREREDTLRRELASRDTLLNEMRQKLDAIERRNSGSELAQLENGKRQAAQAYNQFKDQIRIATEQGNGAAVADATEKMMNARQQYENLTRIETAFKQRQQAPQPLDPRLVTHAENWMTKNKWYNPESNDQDSRVALTLDQQLADEGWDPRTPEYWRELDARVKKYLPHRANSGKMTSVKPKSVVTGGNREGSKPADSSKTYRLSSERVQALKDAGVWDDPKKRADAIKRFRDYDKQNKA